MQILVLWNALETENTITGFIIKGMLERTVEKEYALKIMESGQSQINWPMNSYFQCTSQQTIESSEKRVATYFPWIKQYNDNLSLGATTGLLRSLESASDWVKNIYDACDGESIQEFEDQIPAMKYLFDSFEFVWIYGTRNAGYDLFDANNRDAIHLTIQSLLSDARY